MSLANRCSPDFDPQTRSGGNSYHYSGSVAITETLRDESGQVIFGVRALVSGAVPVPYSVEVDWSRADDIEVDASCTCPRYLDGFLCQHIWATILNADRDGMTRHVPGRGRLYVIHGFENQDDEENDGDQYDEDGERDDGVLDTWNAFLTPSTKRLGYTKPVSGNPKEKQEDWRQKLAKVLAPVAARGSNPLDEWQEIADKHRETWFVLNVSESLKHGKLLVDFFQREAKKNGQLGKLKRLSVRREMTQNRGDGSDEQLLQLVLGNEPQSENSYPSYYYGSSYYADQTYSRTAIAPAAYDLVLPQLCAAGRLLWLLDTTLPAEEARPVAWDGGLPWRFRLQMEADESQQCWHLTGQLYRADETAQLADAVLLLASGIVLFPGRLAKLDARDDFSWLAGLRKSPAIVVPYADRDELLRQLWSQPHVPNVTLPENLRLEQVRSEPQGKLSIKASPRFARNNQLYADVDFLYGPRVVSASEGLAGQLDLEQQRVLLRSPEAERKLLRQLLAEGLERPPYYSAVKAQFQFPKRRLPELVRRLAAQGWAVECEGRRVRRPGRVSLSVTSGVDWFELAGDVDFDGATASLPQLLQALRNNQEFVVLDDGSQGMLPDDWLNRYGGLARLGNADGQTMRFAPSQALLLDALLAAQEAQTSVRVDETFERFREKLRSFTGIRPRGEPEHFCGQLRTYQREGLGWLDFLQDFRFGGCLADDMGLGKTVQVLALLESRRQLLAAPGQRHKPSLVVVPKSLIFNWADEAARFTPQLRLLNFTGLGRATALESLEQYDLLLTTYGTLRRDIVALQAVPFDYVILDEAQAIKNANSQAAKACRLLVADHRLAMSGTPIENHLGELWSLFEFLNPGMLGQSSAFNALTRTGRSDDENALPMLAKSLRPFLLRRTKEQVLSELPKKTEQTLYCEMEPKQRKLYDSLRDYYRASLTQRVEEIGLNRAKIHVLEALLRLRQAACHPGLIDVKKSDEPSAKLELLCEQIAEVLREGHKALIFSQFTSLLAIVRKRFDDQGLTYEYLDGQTRDRRAKVTRFQEDPECRLFLISLKAGGHGLNLTAADYVFILDPWWNPAVEAQAVDRTHRIGQTRPVFAYRLICKGTVEDKILELQHSKRELADAIVSADQGLIRSLTAEDLQLLLS